jgi:transcriptional regulator with XRE-family HTH domain
MKMKSEKNKNTLGIFLKESRLKRHLSQNDVATALRYDSPQYVSDWERGVSSPPMKKLVQISHVLHVSADRIFQLLVESAKQKLEADLFHQYSKIRKKMS